MRLKSLLPLITVSAAIRLHRYSDLSVKEVAYELGYEDVAHFSKFFKKNQGAAFSDFRRGAIHRD
jgi:YesN/AraC family two-component response regulator